MWSAIITGFFTIIGVSLGAYLTWKMQYQNWLFTKRAEIFADLIRTLEKCQEQASQYLKESTEKPRMEIETRVLGIYELAITSAKIARFFVREDSKDRLEKIVGEIRAIHVDIERGDKRFIDLAERHKELQKLLEDNLQKSKWYSCIKKIRFWAI